MKSSMVFLLCLLISITMSGCTVMVIAANLAVTTASAVVGATTSVIGSAVDLVIPDGEEEKK